MYFAVAQTIAIAVISSRLDYCNSLYHNIAIKDILKLQRVQFFFGKGSYMFSSFLSLITISNIITLTPCPILHYF